MLAAVLDNIKEINVREFQNPTIPISGAILKVHSCGICSSDLKFINHGDRVKEFPAILGHEIAGEIIEIDRNISYFNVGDRVALAAEIPCKKCRPCLNDLENLCDNVLSIGTTIQGGFSEFMPITKDLLDRGPINLIPDIDIVFFDMLSTGFAEALTMEAPSLVYNSTFNYEQASQYGKKINKMFQNVRTLFYEEQEGLKALENILNNFKKYKKQLKEPRDIFIKKLAFPVNELQFKNNINKMINK